MYSTDTPIPPPPKSKITPGGRAAVLTEGRNTVVVWRSTVIPNKGYVYLTILLYLKKIHNLIFSAAST